MAEEERGMPGQSGVRRLEDGISKRGQSSSRPSGPAGRRGAARGKAVAARILKQATSVAPVPARRWRLSCDGMGVGRWP